jgi:hypothetical protein
MRKTLLICIIVLWTIPVFAAQCSAERKQLQQTAQFMLQYLRHDTTANGLTPAMVKSQWRKADKALAASINPATNEPGSCKDALESAKMMVSDE